MEQRGEQGPWRDVVTPELADFIGERDSLLGIGFVYHGFPKLFSSAEHEGFVAMLQGIGVPASALTAWIVAIVESLGGLALIAGAYVAVAAVPLAVNMLVALLTVHLPMGCSFMNITGMSEAGPTFGMPGYEVNLLYIAGLVALILGGAGALSIDEMRAARAGSK